VVEEQAPGFRSSAGVSRGCNPDEEKRLGCLVDARRMTEFREPTQGRAIAAQWCGAHVRHQQELHHLVAIIGVPIHQYRRRGQSHAPCATTFGGPERANPRVLPGGKASGLWEVADESG
jgi:hypothetical protein